MSLASLRCSRHAFPLTRVVIFGPRGLLFVCPNQPSQPLWLALSWAPSPGRDRQLWCAEKTRLAEGRLSWSHDLITMSTGSISRVRSKIKQKTPITGIDVSSKHISVLCFLAEKYLFVMNLCLVRTLFWGMVARKRSKGLQNNPHLAVPYLVLATRGLCSSCCWSNTWLPTINAYVWYR
jgi:hypothetical protein